jgi:hypothetical protein
MSRRATQWMLYKKLDSLLVEPGDFWILPVSDFGGTRPSDVIRRFNTGSPKRVATHTLRNKPEIMVVLTEIEEDDLS